ncbi:MAG: PD40 domain-containing protein [Bacteroidaceae bacterium]|nr:PD40 domain-containing protein [Bacteroidaceae bacterium]
MKKILYIVLVAGLLISCGQKSFDVPAVYEERQEQANIYPDYKDVVIPENIAPMNFMVEGCNGMVAVFEGKDASTLTVSGVDRIDMDTTEWRNLLKANAHGNIKVTVYTLEGEKWYKYAPHTLKVAESIDAYLSYRLIEPGYELYRQLGIYQRCLENFEQKPIYENNRSYSDNENHCINCHNFQNYSTDRMLFHVRANHGGTIMINGDKATKIQIKDPNILAAGVYPSWHPNKNIVCFSTNKTGQTFHMYHKEKIEVVDTDSDLLLYDVDKNEVKNLLCTDYFETFPCWSPKGDRLFFCAAYIPQVIGVPDSLRAKGITMNYEKIHYNLMSMAYDEKADTFGTPEVVLDAEAKGKSVTFPRVSPDGKYVLYAEGDYGQFHIWHKSSDLWVKDLENDTCYALTAANSDDVDSYHTWSSNGRWIVFSTRRMDANYTRPFIAYFDKDGKAHKAFCLPQRDPEHNILLMKSYNVPELSRNAVQVSTKTLTDVIYNTAGDTAKYVGAPRTDAVTGATVKR